MDFQLSQEQLLIQQSIKEFVQESVEDSYEFVKSLADLDFLGIFYPETYSGASADFTSYVLAVEEIAKSSASSAVAYANQCCSAAYPLYKWGSEELKQKYLPELFRGERIGALVMNEGSPSTDLLEIKCVAQKEEGYFVLNGQKKYIINALPGNLLVVIAQTGADEFSAFVIEGESEGISYSKPYEKMGLEGLAVADIVFENVNVPASNLIGQLGQGKEIAQGSLSLNNIALAAATVGIAQRALDESLKYGKERVQFGRSILNFEALQVMVGNMAAKIEAVRLLAFKAADLVDHHENYREEAEMALYLAKLTGEEACIDTLQIHGGYGYSKDLGVEQLFRDVKGIGAFDQAEKPLVLSIAKSRIF